MKKSGLIMLAEVGLDQSPALGGLESSKARTRKKYVSGGELASNPNRVGLILPVNVNIYYLF